MMIKAPVAILLILVIFDMVLGSDLLAATFNIGIDSEAIINGSSQTFVIETFDTQFFIDTDNLINAGIALIITLIAMAGLFGIQILASGLSPASIKIILLASAFVGVWAVLTALAFKLIITIEVFGILLYVSLTTVYAFGVITKLTE